MKKIMSVRAAATFLIAFVLFGVWYVVATGYDYSDLAGTYTFNGGGESSTLVLKPDRSFTQETAKAGAVEHTVGEWHRIGKGGVTFSKEFLRLPSQQSYLDKFGPDTSGNKEADGEFGGHFERVLGLYPQLHLDATPTDLTLHRRLFH